MKLNKSFAVKTLSSIVAVNAALYGAYSVKTAMNINLFPGDHTPVYIEQYTGGLVQCTWFPRPQDCKKK